MTVLRSGSATDVGRVRTVNEDLAFEGSTLFAVADGMGGHAGGEVAARLAIESLRGEFERRPSAEGLVDAVRQANLDVWDRSRSDAEVRGMGTTLIAAALVPTPEGDRLVLANVGDSRAYLYRDHTLIQLTVDHSVAEELVGRGELSEAEAAVHPHRHILTRALGVGPDVQPDAWTVEPQQGDRYLLCSDGLTNEVTSDRLAAALERRTSPEETARALVEMANEHGGSDNITVLVLDVEASEGSGAVGTGTEDVRAGNLTVAGAGASAAGWAQELQGADTTVAPPAEDVAHAGDAPGVGEFGDRPTANGASGPVTVVAPVTISPAAEPGEGEHAGAAVPDDRSTPGEGAAEASSAGAGTAVAERPSIELGTGGSPPGHRRRTRGPRLLTVRLLLFLVLLGAVAYGAYAVVRWYVDNSYYVQLDGHQRIVVYQGRLGGFLWLKPKLVVQTGVPESAVPPQDVTALQGGVEESSRQAALCYIQGLVTLQSSLQSAPTGSAASTTTTLTRGCPATAGGG